MTGPHAPGARTPAEADIPELEGSILSDDDLHWFNEGTHTRLYRHLGAHIVRRRGVAGVNFAVWAPNAERVTVIGSFNDWTEGHTELRPVAGSGVWEGFAPGVGEGALYKYRVRSRERAYWADKTDPFGFMQEESPRTASVVKRFTHDWGDARWMRRRARNQGLDKPISVYEVHLGSWKRSPDDPERFLGYGMLAPMLADYIEARGYTHVEFMPVTEHPLYRSWGYQTTGYFAPTSRYGDPEEFARLVDLLHQRGIGVILDWVPSHFPSDEHGLGYFDGTHLYEHADPRLGFHPDWKSLIFNYGRHEVRSFLLSSALFWLERFHIDGIRVDAVASMLYLDYSREEGEWLPNRYGGRENLEAIDFLRRFNDAVHAEHPGVITIAEESTSWPMVSRPTDVGGLGFDYKWDMGWMHDTLKHVGRDPVHRRYHHNELTFRGMYQFSENFMLPLSHDEVVHGKGSLLRRMPGDDWQKFANLRLLLANQWTQPGKKLLFMGCDFGQWDEWDQEKSLDWNLAGYPPHAGVQRLVSRLNELYRTAPELHALDTQPGGFEWVNADDADNGTVSFLRRGEGSAQVSLVVMNYTPVPREDYRVGVPLGGVWREALNTDASEYGGGGLGNLGGAASRETGGGRFAHEIEIVVPPLAAVVFRYDAGADPVEFGSS